MADNKQQEQIKEITERLEKGVKEIFTSEKYTEYLRVMSQFHNYSFSNTVLIAMQKPNATLVAGYAAWQKKFERNVLKGEKAIKIFAPAPRKIEVERDMIDPATKKPILDENGEVKKETVTVQKPYFKVTSVFDVSQTDGKPLPELAEVNDLTANVEGYSTLFEALKRTSKVPMDFEPIEGESHGFYHQVEKRIAIAEGMSEAQNVKTAIHEIAHSRMHDVDKNEAENSILVDRRTREVQAESVAYAVCQHFGIETSEYSFGYIAGWSEGKDMKELRGSMEVIRREADGMINDIEGHLKDIQRERASEVEKSAEQPSLPITSGNTEPSEALKGHSREDIEKTVLEAAQQTLEEMGLDESVKLLGAKVYGSRTREGLYNEQSDVDVVLSYDAPNGELHEDTFFNALNENGLRIDGLPVDINPISLSETGTLDQYMTRAEAYLDRKELHETVQKHLGSYEEHKDDLLAAAKTVFPEASGDSLQEVIKSAVVDVLRENAETMDGVELFGCEGVFTNGRVNTRELPEGLYAYDLRGSDDDPGQPVTVEPLVMVNHAGTVILAEKLDLPENGYLELGENLSFTGETDVTLEEFFEKAAPGKGETVYENSAKEIAEKAVAIYEGKSEMFDYLDKEKEKILTDTVEKLDFGVVAYMEEKAAEALRETEKLEIVPFYNLTYSEANEAGIVEAWRASLRESEKCAWEISTGLGAAYNERHMPEFLQDMVDKYGMERCQIVFASTVQLGEHDGRYYPSTKADAAKIEVHGANNEDFSKDMRRHYYTNSHPVMVNSAFRALQKMERQQTQEQTKAPAAVERDAKAPRTSVLSRLQEKQKQISENKTSPAKTEDRKRGVEL